MKSFNFKRVQQRLSKSKIKSVQQKETGDDFLKLYEDLPTDPKMESLCQKVKNEFDEKISNNRYYSYHLDKQHLPDATKYRLSDVQKLRNFQIGFKPETKKIVSLSLEEIIKAEKQEQQRKKKIRQKFRHNVKVVIEKLKKLKMKVDDVINLQIFSKEPYKFGRGIFDAIKEGNQQRIWQILMVNKLSIFSVDHTQKSPLIWACIRNHHSIAKSLIDAGSDPNKEDQNGFNALYYAIKYDSAECVRVLMIELTWFDDSHANSTLSASEKVRNIFRLGSNLSKAMRKIDPEKREGLFNEQYRYFYE